MNLADAQKGIATDWTQYLDTAEKACPMANANSHCKVTQSQFGLSVRGPSAARTWPPSRGNTCKIARFQSSIEVLESSTGRIGRRPPESWIAPMNSTPPCTRRLERL